jgi:hypothetical protein
MGIYVFLTEITSAVRRRCRLRLVSRCGNNVGRQDSTSVFTCALMPRSLDERFWDLGVIRN